MDQVVNDELVDDILSLCSDIVMAADVQGVLDENQLDQLNHLIEVYFQERVNGTEQPH